MQSPGKLVVAICICAFLLHVSTAETSSCTLLIPSLLSASGVDLTDFVRCGNHILQNIQFSNQCHPSSGNVMSCTSPLRIHRNNWKTDSGSLLSEEEVNVPNDNSSQKNLMELFIECIDREKGICTRTFHHTVSGFINEIPNRLDAGINIFPEHIASISQIHCNSTYIDKIFCTWVKETVISQPSNILMELMRRYLLYDGERRITKLTILNNAWSYEYAIDSLHAPITDQFSSRSSTTKLISYDVFSYLRQLEDVTVMNVTTTHLPPNLFLRNTKLKSCIMNYIMLEEVPPGLFKNTVMLRDVDLRYNKLETLPEDVFQNNRLLRNLQLAWNRLKYLPSRFLLNNNNLTTLDLSHNQLQDLQLVLLSNPPETTYASFTEARPVPKTFGRRYRGWRSNEDKKLEISNAVIKTNTLSLIDISYNQFERIPEGIFNGSIILTILRAHHNLGVMNLTGSHLFLSLKEFSMSDCSINSINEDFFAKTSDNKPLYIQKIDLSRNTLNTIHRRTFWNCQELEVLLLNKNKLTKLEDGVFKDLINLRQLGLSGNMFSVFQSEAFSLRNIVNLDFSWNRIHNFDPLQLVSLLQSSSDLLKRIDLSHNCLTTKKIILPSLNVSRPLFLKNVTIRYALSQTNTTRQGERKRFQLDFNGTKPIFVERKYNTDSIKNINFLLQMIIGPIEEGTLFCPNPFKQFCSHFPQSCGSITNVTWEVSNELLTRLVLLQCNERSTEDASIEDAVECPFTATCSRNYYKSISHNVAQHYNQNVSFTCPVITNCPYPCRCYQRVIENDVVVDCNQKGLTYLPTQIPPLTSVLYFNDNKLQTLHQLKSSIWSNLEELYLENNAITSTDKVFFPPKLKLISLRNNQLESIDKDYLVLLNDTEIYLSGNPWICDCNTRFLKAKLNTVNKVRDAKWMLCASINTPIIDVPNDILCPETLEVSFNFGLVMSLGIILPVFVGILLASYYRNKQLVKAFMFTNFPGIFKFCCQSRDLNSGKKFDAFVSYSSFDRDIVMQIIEELENKEPHFSLCIHERDWLPGNAIITNIAKSVCSSRRTIIILSMEFIQSVWFPVELQTVYYQMLQEKTNRAIIVVRGKIPPTSEVDAYLQVLLKTKTYLVWGERWFWEKLRYSLYEKHFNGDILEDNRADSNFIAKIEADIANSGGIEMNVF